MSHEETLLEDEERWLILRAKVTEERIKSAFRLLRDKEIEPVLIKGWAAAREYPERHLRNFSDIDLCVSPAMYEKSLALIDGEEGRKLNIDLHRGLRHLDTLEWEELFQNSLTVPVDEVPFRVLRPEDHLRVLCVHWLTDGGAHKEKLLDIFYLLQNHKEDFEWDFCFRKTSPKRRRWIIKTIAVTHRYYGLDVSDLPFADELRTIPGWFMRALEKEWASGAKLKPMHVSMGSGNEFWNQLKKRFPPNAIQATIDMEGEFDESSRFYYQMGSILLRLKPSVKRIFQALKLKWRGRGK
jgi:hypothetical protein